MHIVKGVYTTSKKPKKKKKAEKVSFSAMELEWRKYNKDMRKSHCHNLQFKTLDDYIQYRSSKPKKYTKEFQEYVPEKTFERKQQKYASIPPTATDISFSKPERPEYTGDYIVGIATMHKSNLVPVGRDDNPKDYSTMRRN
ncbi:hypothetical protein N9H77_02685 [Porticoccaceae bacterium]|nr:hypothetical protein [Porticoccaceae bacterium]MDB4559184.1 hypothetical protein [bacterium]